MGNRSSNGSTSVLLSRGDIDVIMANASTTEDEIKRWHYQFVKMAPDGKMTFETFAELYKCCNPGMNTDSLARILFRNLDKVKSGYITFLDFFITNSVYRRGDAKTKARLFFDLCDSDKNGSICTNELKEMLIALYQLRNCSKQKNWSNLAKAKAKEIISRIDLNNDRLVQRSEFVYSMLVDRDTASLLDFDFGFDVPLPATPTEAQSQSFFG